MNKSPLLISLLFFSKANLFAAVNPDDIAFTLFDGDNGIDQGSDQFAFVALNPIAADEEIYFRDDEWNGTAFSGTAGGGVSEDEFLWTAPPEGIDAGTIVTFSNETIVVDAEETMNAVVNLGTVEQTIGTGGLSISGAGEDIWAFIGTSNTPTTFLAAISSDGFADVGTTLDGTGLTAGTAFAIELTQNIDHAQYIGPREGLPTIPSFDFLIANVAANWFQESPTGVDFIADTTSFTTAGVLQTLSLTFSPTTISEDAGTAASVGTVSLSFTQDTDIIVNLTSNDISEVTVPETVTILANTLSTTFDLNAVDDLLDDGDRTVTILARSPGTVENESSLIVTDDADNPTTALSTGDILFTCFNGDSNSFGFVAITDIPANEEIFFTDEEWNDSIDAFGGGESDIIWTAPAEGLSAGEVILINDVNDPSLTGPGSILVTGNTGLNGNADTIYAYQGPALRQPVTFLASITNHTGDSIVNTGLTEGINAFSLLVSADYGEYIAARSGQDSIADYAPLIADLTGNWIMDVNGDNAAIICNSTNFVIGAASSITIIDCGIIGDNFFIDIAEGTDDSLVVTSSNTLDFANSTSVNATPDPENSSRLLIPASERNPLQDFFRVETP